MKIMRAVEIEASAFFITPVAPHFHISTKILPPIRPRTPAPAVHHPPKKRVSGHAEIDGIGPSRHVPHARIVFIVCERGIHPFEKCRGGFNVVLYYDDFSVFSNGFTDTLDDIFRDSEIVFPLDDFHLRKSRRRSSDCTSFVNEFSIFAIFRSITVHSDDRLLGKAIFR